jgi:hypothetical protein
MALRYIGPVAVRIRNPQFHWTSAPDGLGIRDCTVSGVMQWVSAQQCAELVDNPDRLVTIGAQAGVLEYLVFDDALLLSQTGWYLLQSFELQGDQQWSGHGLNYPVAFSLKAAFLGDNREATVVASSRSRANDFSITGLGTIGVPWFTEGGTDSINLLLFNSVGANTTTAGSLNREYDYRAYAASLPTLSPTGSKVVLLANAGSPTNWATYLPTPRRADAAIPTWVTNRGGDCRAYDVTQAREVYGPSHRFATTADCIITNGLLRVVFVARGVTAGFELWAFQGGQWVDMGLVTFGNGSVPLLNVYLRRCTPDEVSVRAFCDLTGGGTFTLKRGERMVRCRLGNDRPPYGATGGSLYANSGTFAASSGGRRVQTAFDANGFKKVLMALHPISDDGSQGIKLTTTATQFDAGIALARSVSNDDVADQHTQFVGSAHQELRVR